MKRFLSTFIAIILILLPATNVFAADYHYGYDVSEHNEVISSQIMKSGKDFVMIRLGYTTDHIDKKFYENVKAAYENKIPYGVYYYSYAYDDSEAKGDADYVLKTIESLGEYKEYLKLPVAYDLEDNRIAALGKTQVSKQIKIFCDKIMNAGYVPMVYANTNWFNNYIDTSVIKNNGYKVWYAYYPDVAPDFSKPITVGNTGLVADMWQYKQGSVPDGILDENVIYNLESLSHVFKQDKITKATFNKDGLITYKCAICSKTKTQTIPAIKTVKLKSNSFVYNGKVKKPAVSVLNSKASQISASNYSLTYSNNKNVGTATATITFKGNYSGKKNLTFKIVPKATTIKNITAIQKGFNLKWSKVTAQTSGYQIEYSLNRDFKKSKKITIANNKTTTKKVQKLAKGKKYYVRIRTYRVVKSKKYYSAWSGIKNVKTK